MKTYYLKLTTEDFTKGDSVWTSGIIDFYDNYSAASEMATPSYRNYSTIKSNYGLNLLRNGTFTGMEMGTIGAATPTELGTVEGGLASQGGRFIDESGRIDVVDYEISFSAEIGTAPISSALDLYTADESDASFPDEWAFKQGVFGLRYLGEVSSYRYGKVVLRLTSDQNLDDVDVEVIIRVRIGEPLQGGIAYKSVRDSLMVFPEWMDIRELENENPADPSMATPLSVGGAVLNAVAGEWLDEIRGDIAYAYAQMFINTVDVTQPDWVYSVTNVSPTIYNITGDGTELARCVNLRDFYDLTDEEDGFWYNEADKILFVNKSYDDFRINYVTRTLAPHQIWNWFDEYGLRVDLKRLRLESNESYKARILDVFINRPGVGVDAFKLALRRELSLWQYYTNSLATPDSYYQGATPEVLEMPDIEIDSEFVDIQGVPTKKFVDLVEELAKGYPSTWGFFKWNEATWDAGGDQGGGYDVLPQRWDATPLSDANVQSGVGDGNDLFVHRPDEVTGAREFTGKLKMRGRHKATRTEARKIEFNVNVWGEGPYNKYDNPTVTVPLTVEVVLESGTYYHVFTLSSKSDVNDIVTQPTASSYGQYSFLTDAGLAIPGLEWIDESNVIHTVGVDDFDFDRSTISSLILLLGTWNGSTFVDAPVDDEFTAWLPGTSATLEAGDVSIAATVIAASVTMVSKVTSFSSETWASEKQRFKIQINGSLPDQGLLSYVLPVPTIVWRGDLTGAKTYKVEMATYEDSSIGRRGGFTVGADGHRLFIPDDYITINGSTAWDINDVQEFVEATEEFEFESITAATPSYPVSDCPYWAPFEAEQNVGFEGVVDENGPWRNGVAPQEGNTNFNLLAIEVDRSDFSIPQSENYVVTWMGVNSDNDRVIVWLDSNTVKPSFDDGTQVEYPTSSIEEQYDSGTYSYGPMIVRARLNVAISPEWEPQVHSGWFYDRDEENYMYSIPADEQATLTSSHKTLGGVARMGAPIIVKTDQSTPVDYRQVAFWDDATPGYTMYAKQIVPGTGDFCLFVGYEDVYDASVIDLNTGLTIAASTFTSTSRLATSLETDKLHDYEVTYKVNRSFFADNDFVGDDNTQRTNLVFDQPLATPVTVTYETSKFDPATPVDLPLNTFYTIMDEGYIFISYNEYDLSKVEVRVSPSSIVANGEDYLMVTLRSLDAYGNPKPNAQFTLSTDFGTLSDTSVTTNDDGFAAIKLTSEQSNTDLEGTITISGDVDAEVSFEVSPVNLRAYRITAVPNVQQIPADGVSTVYVFGKVETTEYEPVPYAYVYWRKGRYMHDIWTRLYSTAAATPGSSALAGRVVADEDGIFTIGPFLSATPDDPGYWMMAVESESASPHDQATPNFPPSATPTTWDLVAATPDWDMAGDVVFWVEYPHYQHGVENLNGLPRSVAQMRQRPDEIPDYAPPGRSMWPTFYDEATPLADATPMGVGDINYLPADWYAIDRYKQYQLGLLGSNRTPQTASDLADSHPDYRKY